ncbi:MAG TPA: response regulator transcription factor [Flavobacteriales bacterium]|nr:response regulator transcription factor [Flavobacteriales bacterium]
MKSLTVLLAEDHTIVREGLRKILDLADDVTVVGEAGNGREAVLMAKRLIPAVVLMDIAMPLLNGFEATRQILRSQPDTRVLMLSAYSDEAYVHTAIEAGVVGFLLKQTSANDLCHAIREVHAGRTFFVPQLPLPHQVLTTRLPPARPLGPEHNRKPRLSPREREVLQLIAEGKANKETAAGLGISIKTVEKHREHLMRKLGIHDTAGLTRYAIAVGIIESSAQVIIR